MPLPDNILQPIAGDNPCGAELRYQPVYDQIKEARREDDDADQGVWQRARKMADWAQVVKLASNAIAKQSKDLQLAAWLTEGLVYREGIQGLREGLQLTHDLLDQFWDNLYPELEDGDSEMRSVPLAYIVSRMDIALRKTPLTPEGVSWYEYKDSLTIPTEAEAGEDSEKGRRRSEAEESGKLTPEDVDDALKRTPAAHFDEVDADVGATAEVLQQLDQICDEKFGDYAPGYGALKECLEQLQNTVRIMKQRRETLLGGGAPAAPARGGRAAKKKQEDSGWGAEESSPDSGESTTESSSGDGWGGGDGYSGESSDSTATESSSSDDGWDSSEESSSSWDTETPAKEESSSSSGSWDTAEEEAASSYGETISAEPQNPEDAVRRIAAAALWLRTQAPANPGPYLLLRALRWGELRASGPQLEWEQLESAPSEIRQRLKRQAAEAQWDDVLASCEEAMALPCGRAWLDLHRYQFEALSHLGEEYTPLHEAMRRELRQILSEYPDLPNQSLTDDTPAANAQTLAFLRNEGLLGGAPAKPAEPAVRRAPTQEEMIETAVKAKKFEVALALVARALQQETSGRGRFERKVLQARLLMDAGRRGVAYPILRELAGEIFERRLDEWESASLVVEPLMLLYRCLDGEQNESGERQKIYELICRLDPVRAFELH
jgi:type VI secretion system protein ImpA